MQRRTAKKQGQKFCLMSPKSETEGQLPTHHLFVSYPLILDPCFLLLTNYSPQQYISQYHHIPQNIPKNPYNQSLSATHPHHRSTWVFLIVQSIVATETSMRIPGKFSGFLLINSYSTTRLNQSQLCALISYSCRVMPYSPTL